MPRVSGRSVPAELLHLGECWVDEATDVRNERTSLRYHQLDDGSERDVRPQQAETPPMVTVTKKKLSCLISRRSDSSSSVRLPMYSSTTVIAM